MIECYILAGGASRRFGEDKTLFSIFGKPLISHVVERASLICDRVCIVIKDKSKYKFLEGVCMVEDKGKEHFALMGVLSAIENSESEKVIILTSDMPFVSPSLIYRLYTESKPPITVYNVNGRVYPFPGLYYKKVLKSLEEQISSGNKRVMDFLQRVGYVDIRVKGVSFFRNINTRKDLEFIFNSMERIFLVKGMTCQHCVNTVKRALFDVEGVSHVEVDLQKGEVKVNLESDVPFETLKDAVERWGYSVIGEV